MQTHHCSVKTMAGSLKRIGFLLMIWLTLAVFSKLSAQPDTKMRKPAFCGYQYRDTALVRKHLGPQLAFLKIQSGDTIVDVGSSSGSYLGLFATIAQFDNVHFILVDIDTTCLNSQKLKNMKDHYSLLRGSDLPCTFSFVNNTVDSLHLPLARFKKVLFFNTLHEIENRESMVKQLTSIIAPGGELIISEIMPTAKHKKHGVCRWPLISEAEIIDLFEPHGFKIVEKANLQVNPRKVEKVPYFFFRLMRS